MVGDPVFQCDQGTELCVKRKRGLVHECLKSYIKDLPILLSALAKCLAVWDISHLEGPKSQPHIQKRYLETRVLTKTVS